ncbi:hypothetical protein GCM10022286_23520 [Gryllotalpicola daejeonensis]|uniref:DUF3558 domain-containing protein n=2 Tax=Gryllotalpicola daejeonensis TaxID=993087 RepID=A0ABP7ZLP3_9MICO
MALVALALSGCAGTPGTWFTPSRPTISVTATASCPAVLGSARDVPDRSGGSGKLLPDSRQPTAALVCSYKNRDLASQTQLGAEGSRELASVINKIDLAKPKGNFNCPALFDEVTIMAFQFGHADDVDLWWNASGCQTLDNGRLGAFEGANPSFYEAFQNTYARLVPAATR